MGEGVDCVDAPVATAECVDPLFTSESEGKGVITVAEISENQECAEETPAEVMSVPQESAEAAYLRGRNDAIREMMNRPGLYGAPVERHYRVADSTDNLAADFLTRIRPSAWD